LTNELMRIKEENSYRTSKDAKHIRKKN